MLVVRHCFIVRQYNPVFLKLSEVENSLTDLHFFSRFLSQFSQRLTMNGEQGLKYGSVALEVCPHVFQPGPILVQKNQRVRRLESGCTAEHPPIFARARSAMPEKRASEASFPAPYRRREGNLVCEDSFFAARQLL